MIRASGQRERQKPTILDRLSKPIRNLHARLHPLGEVSFEEEQRRIATRWPWTSPIAEADWWSSRIARSHSKAPCEFITKARKYELDLRLRSNDMAGALRVARNLARYARSAGERRIAAGRLAEVALTRTPPNFEVLEEALECGPIEGEALVVLAERWAATGRTDKRALRLYCKYSKVLKGADPEALAKSLPLRRLRECSRVDDSQTASELREAIDLNMRARLANPQLSWPPAGLGLAALRRGDEEAAERYLSEAKELGEADPHLDLTLGRILLDRGEEARALECFERAQASGVAEVEILLWTAVVKSSLGRSDEALQMLTNSKDSLAPDARVEALTGTLLLDLGFIEKARGSFEAALGIDASNVEARYGVARCCQAEGDLSGAEKILTTMATARPKDPWLAHALGDVAAARGDTAGALDHLRVAQDLEPDNPIFSAHLGLALAHAEIDDPEAEAFLTAAYAADQRSDELLEALGRIRMVSKDWQGAVHYWSQIESADSGLEQSLAIARHNEALRHLDMGDAEGALELWHKIPESLAAGLPVVSGRLAAGEMLLEKIVERGNLEEARELASTLAGLAPEDPGVRYWQGVLLLLQSDSAALDYLKGAAHPGAEILSEILRCLLEGTDGEALRGVLSRNPGVGESLGVVAQLFDRDWKAIASALRSGVVSLESLPFEARRWLPAAAHGLFGEGCPEEALALLDSHPDTSGELRLLRLACHLRLAAESLDKARADNAIQHLEQAKGYA